MRRTLAPLIILSVVASACLAQQPPERAPLPEVSTAVTTPPSCAAIAGPAVGVHVDDVSPGTASDGVIEPGDILLTFDGVAIPTAADLLDALSQRSAGDTVTLGASRSGESLELAVTLGENPQRPERPLLGVSVMTEYDEIPLDSVDGASGDFGPHSRMVTIGDRIFALDPTNGRLGRTDLEPSDTLSLVVAGVQYRIVRDDVPRLVDGAGRTITLSTGDSPLGILTSFDGDLILVAQSSSDGAQLPVLIRAGARTGDVIWVQDIDPERGIPVFAQASPDRRRVLIGSTTEGAAGLSYGVVDARTGALDPVAGDLPDIQDGVSFGWFDGNRLVTQTLGTTPALLDVTDLSTEPVELPFEANQGTRIWAIGDGLGLIVDNGETLGLARLDGTAEVQPITRRCDVAFVDQPGSAS